VTSQKPNPPTADAADEEESTSLGVVLILDDDIDVLAANARFLRVSGYTVLLSNTASLALEHLQENGIDAIVTDLRMPEMDGLEFAREARMRKPLVPLLFFSAFASVADVVSAMKLGAVDFLEKPVDPELLLERLDDICGSYQIGTNQPRIAFDDSSSPFRQRVLAYEKYLIETCFQKNDGSVAAVMDELKINRRTLNEKMTRLGIKRQ